MPNQRRKRHRLQRNHQHDNARPDRWTDRATSRRRRLPLSALDGNAYGAGARAARRLPDCQFAAADLISSIINNYSHSHVINDIGMTSGMGI